MKLAGEVVAVKKADFLNEAGSKIDFFRIYLKAGDPIAGALEVSVSEEQFGTVTIGDKISFVPSFSARKTQQGASVVVRVLDDLTVLKA